MRHAPTPVPDDIPVTKVGAVILRLRDGQPQVLLNQPRPKPLTPEDMPSPGLVRGTRMYQDASGQMLDANHDGRTPPPEGAVLEPLQKTLAREVEEEASLTLPMLELAQVKDLGAYQFPSRKKEPYPIHWYGVMLDEVAADALPLDGHRDALHTRWASLAELKAMVVEGRMSPGYVPIAELAVAQMGLAATARLARSHPDTPPRLR